MVALQLRRSCSWLKKLIEQLQRTFLRQPIIYRCCPKKLNCGCSNCFKKWVGLPQILSCYACSTFFCCTCLMLDFRRILEGNWKYILQFTTARQFINLISVFLFSYPELETHIHSIIIKVYRRTIISETNTKLMVVRGHIIQLQVGTTLHEGRQFHICNGKTFEQYCTQ